jgi:hypothetical protein
MKRKCLVIGIILLFIGVSLSPAISAESIPEISTLNRSIEKTVVRLWCYEYKPDGTIEKTTIVLSRNTHREMTQTLSLTTSMEEKLAVYQRYGIIPSNVTIQGMKKNFDQYLIMKNIDVSEIHR